MSYTSSLLLKQPKGNVFALLDVGTSKVLCFVMKITSNAKIGLLGIGHQESLGIRSGAIMNVAKASHCIVTAVQYAEKNSKELVDQVYANISSCGLKSQTVSTEIAGSNREISLKDINRIAVQANNQIPSGEVIVHNIPLNYNLDGIEGISDPIKMYGSELSMEANIITVLRTALLNLEHCITQCPLNLNGCSVSAYTAGIACLSNDEIQVGTAILDIGGGSTSIGIFKGGNMIYANVIPVGGLHITQDITCAFNIDLKTAERIKVVYGSAIITTSEINNVIDVNDDDNNETRISLAELVNVIKPRVEEILEMCKKHLNGFNINKIVITGGTSHLINIRELTSYIMNQQIRIGTPQIVDGMNKEHNNNSYSAIVGLSMLVNKMFQNPDPHNNSQKYLDKILTWLKN